MNILELLQAAGGIQPEAQGQAPEIQVAAPPPRQITEDTRSEPSPRKTDELVQRKGVFGVKGTLRDILGLVGDSFLVGSGKKAIYQPIREQEKLGSAIYGYNDDPVAAIDRTALVNPETAMDLQKQYGQDQRTDQLIQGQRIAGQQKAASTLGSWLGAIQKSNDPGGQYRLVRDKLRAYAQANKIDDLYDLPDEYDPQSADTLFRSSMDPNEQADNDRQDMTAADMKAYRESNLGISRQRVSEQRRHNQKMESRPTASRAPSRPSASNVDAEVLSAIQAGTATPAQQRYYEGRLARAQPKGGGSVLDRLRSGNTGSKGPPPPPNGGSFRKVK